MIYADAEDIYVRGDGVAGGDYNDSWSYRGVMIEERLVEQRPFTNDRLFMYELGCGKSFLILTG